MTIDQALKLIHIQKKLIESQTKLIHQQTETIKVLEKEIEIQRQALAKMVGKKVPHVSA